jgi:ATP-binding cassette subfamily C protein CydD
VVALATLGTLATVVIAWQLSMLVTKIFVIGKSVTQITGELLLVVCAGLVKAVVIWAQESLSARAAVAVKIELRRKLFDAIAKLRTGWLKQQSIAEVNLLATTGLDSLDSYFSKYLPQLVYTALITPALVVVIWLQDFQSGIALVATLPLIPIFMILIGMATSSVQDKQLSALTRLTQHFLEVLRGLTTLRIFNRAIPQVKTIAAVSEQYRVRTLKVLRITFLSGFALEMLSSLAVALIAVSIGLRLVDGEISLLVGLFVLILAPEVYLPIRQVGAHFHSAAEGITASKKVLDIIDQVGKISDGTTEPTVSSIYSFEPGKITAIVGPSGIGKSTIFRKLMGLESQEQAIPADSVSWMPQQAALFAGTVRENILGPKTAQGELGFDLPALNLAMQYAALDDLTLDTKLGVGAVQISGGQAQRVSLARAFYRAITKETQYLFLDEPTSAIDAAREAKVLAVLKHFADNGRSVVVITHQRALTNSADRVIQVNNV